jgi:hypothetical protein
MQTLTDTLLAYLVAVLDKMPRVTGNDQVAVSIESGSVGISSNQTLATLGTINAVGGRWPSGDNMNNAGVMHIYNNILVN